ncbi:MAG: DNA-3-methyladenine glycosylase, partial [Kovacikia sp.]
PGKLCRALKIDLSINATPLQPGSPLWLEKRSSSFQQQLDGNQVSLTQTTRVGLTQGADLPWRWYLTNAQAVSKKG